MLPGFCTDFKVMLLHITELKKTPNKNQYTRTSVNIVTQTGISRRIES